MVSVTLNIISLVIESIIYTFHASILFLLFCKRKTTFKGAFYNIFQFVIIADLGNYLALLIGSRATIIFMDFFKTNQKYIPSFVLSLFTITTLMQYLGHMFMAFNRFTLFWFPLKHEQIWRNKWYIYALILLPFFHVCYRLHEPGAFIFSDDNSTVLWTYKNKELMSFVFTITTILYFATTCLSAIFNILSCMKIFCWSKTTMPKINEKSLFFVTFIIFISQTFRLCNNVGRPLFASNEIITAFILAALPYVSDIFAWTGTASLILLSPTTRKEYITFYYSCKNHLKIPSSLFP